MTDQGLNDPLERLAPDEVAFDYVKSHDFRVVWADGALGSITPNGLMHFALYAERTAIPRRQVFAIESSDGQMGKLGAEKLDKRISRNSIVREMACDVFMSLSAAENLANWLLAHVNAAKQATENQQ